MKRKLFACLIILFSVISEAAEVILPDPKPPELSAADQKLSDSSLAGRREAAKIFFKMYTEAYNSEFKEKNGLSMSPVPPETLAMVFKKIDTNSEAELKVSPIPSLIPLKKHFDTLARQAFNQANADAKSQIKLLGASVNDIIVTKNKLSMSEANNSELKNRILRLESEIENLMKENITAKNAVQTATDQLAKVMAEKETPATVVAPTVVNAEPKSTSNIKIISAVLAALGLGFLFFRSKAN